MGTPWEDNIKKSKQVTVFPTGGLSRSTWGSIFKTAITDFNRLAVTHKLGVSLVATISPPDPDGDGGANIQCDISNGNAKYKALGEEKSVSFSGSRIHGLTRKVMRAFGNNPLRLFKCFVFVPANPTIEAPTGRTGQSRQRTVGDGVKLVILVHELIHAAGGLEDSEHSGESDPDVFVGLPTVDAEVHPKDDTVRVGVSPNFTRFPPNTLSAKTAGLIIQNWK